MYKDTITLFNRARGTDGDIWYPTILRNVNVNMDKGSVIETYGAEATDNVVLNVRCIMDGDEGTLLDGTAYLPPKKWQRSTDKALAVTFTPGTAHDFFWVGEWDGGLAYDENYGDMSFYDYMLSNYDFVYAVTGTSYFSVIPHLQVTGR